MTSRRPFSIRELAARSWPTGFDSSKSLKDLLHIAAAERNAGDQAKANNNIDGAFIHYAKGSTLLLEDLPTHPKFDELTPTQKVAVAVHGQAMLDTLDALKGLVAHRLFDWCTEHLNADLSTPVVQQQQPARHQGQPIQPEQDSYEKVCGAQQYKGARSRNPQRVWWSLPQPTPRSQPNRTETKPNGSAFPVQLARFSRPPGPISYPDLIRMNQLKHGRLLSTHSMFHSTSFARSLTTEQDFQMSSPAKPVIVDTFSDDLFQPKLHQIHRADLTNRTSELFGGTHVVSGASCSNIPMYWHATQAQALQSSHTTRIARPLSPKVAIAAPQTGINPDDISRIPKTISGTMPASEVISILVQHGCPNITQYLDLENCGNTPIFGGGFGDIYQGFLHKGTRVAIKCARFYLQHNDENRHKVLKHAAAEIYAWSRIKHQNIMPLVGLAQYHGQIAMLSPWMDNGTLLQYIAHDPTVDRLELLIGVSEGVAYLHAEGIIHGDIKSSNVLISQEGIPKLIDFGCTELKKSTLCFTTTTNGLSISIRWAAPEILAGDVIRSREADVYALGMTLLVGQTIPALIGILANS
ncbi:Tyrosine kinase catalytic domain protein [Ceratobasidium sp. AG-Ba]|nr:Tyrosine kinase catalytic domain protein [Ceratobasidium sp. AG-Ba]